MKKYLLLAFAALVSFSLFSCGDDDAADNGLPHDGSKSYVGSWEMLTEYDYTQFIFSEKEFTYLYGSLENDGNRFMRHKITGTYTEQDGIVTLCPQKSFQPDYNNGNKIIEVPLDDDMKKPVHVKISVLAGGSAVVLECQDEQGSFVGDRMLFTKQDCKVDVNSVQGRWIWYVGDTKNTRIYIEISGNKFDLIIPIYGERYQGTVSAGANGMLDFKTEKYLVRDNREDMPYSDQLFKDWRDRNEEEMQWRLPHFYEEDGPHTFSLPFIVDGKVAYCTILGLTALFEKQ